MSLEKLHFMFDLFRDVEAPVWNVRDPTKLTDLKGFYNWSMSYRLDSNFPVPYGSMTNIAPEPLKDDLGKTV